MAVNWSGAKNNYQVILTDGSQIDVTTSVIDAIAWERNNKRGYLDTGSPSYEQMLWTAWAAARRQGMTKAATFNEFFPKVDDFGMVSKDADDDQEAVDPTPGAASPE